MHESTKGQEGKACWGVSLLRPIEVDSFFLHFNSESTLTVSELEARPQVLLIGQPLALQVL